jgi:hypothetical protein
MTCVAVMVVPLAVPLVFAGERLTLVVPSVRTLSPVVMALAEVELAPFIYDVEDASFTVTFTPASVVIVKLEVDTLSTVPVAPPESGPHRALDGWTLDPGDAPPMDGELVGDGDDELEGNGVI